MDGITIGLLGFLGALFVITGLPKMLGVAHFAEAFDDFGYPQWTRHLAGWAEFIGGLLMITGIWVESAAPVGAAMILPVIVGATWTNYTKTDSTKGTVVAILTLAVLATLVLSLQAR